jgi:hypothetical protein
MSLLFVNIPENKTPPLNARGLGEARMPLRLIFLDGYEQPYVAPVRSGEGRAGRHGLLADQDRPEAFHLHGGLLQLLVAGLPGGEQLVVGMQRVVTTDAQGGQRRVPVGVEVVVTTPDEHGVATGRAARGTGHLLCLLCRDLRDEGLPVVHAGDIII